MWLDFIIWVASIVPLTIHSYYSKMRAQYSEAKRTNFFEKECVGFSKKFTFIIPKWYSCYPEKVMLFVSYTQQIKIFS